ncbi:MAG: protein arginine kinase [Peptococcaceae bacterium]|nr:protein arginine kinase [Peptococcaceae bacterium]
MTNESRAGERIPMPSKVQQLLSEPSLWMRSESWEPTIVVSTRVRLARNLAGWPFPHALPSEKSCELEKIISQILAQVHISQNSLHALSMEALTDNEKRILVEKHLMSPEFAEGDRPRTLFLSRDHRVAIMVNEEDHIRIQILEGAGDYLDAWRLASDIDDQIEDKAPLAFHKKFGYLTACPTNVGTGLRLSVMLHLPGLGILGQVREVIGALAQMGVAVRGLYGEKSQFYGNLYQISNQITLGKSEEDTMGHLDAMTQKVVEKEIQARSHLAQEGRLILEDQVWRARGTLKNARLLSADEAFKTLSLDRLGMDMDILPKSDVSYLETLVNCLPGTLQDRMAKEDEIGREAEMKIAEEKIGETELEKTALEVARAAYLRRTFGGG